MALCEGPIAGVGRVWADGRPLDLGGVTHRLHLGSEDQAPDPGIAARMGTGPTPAHRGTAYLVFEELALAPFGNRLPELAVEVFRRWSSRTPSRACCAVTLIPDTAEFA